MATDFFLTAEPIIHELKAGIGVLICLSSASHEVEHDEIGFVADNLNKAIERLLAAWENEGEKRQNKPEAQP